MNLPEFLRQIKIYNELANSTEETFQRGEARVLMRELREILAPPVEYVPQDKIGETLVKHFVRLNEGKPLIEYPKKKGRQPMKSTQLPKDFEISDNVYIWWGDQDGSIEDLEKEFQAFKDFHISKGNVFKDWDAALRTWMRNSKKFGAARKPYKAEVKSDWKDVTDFDKEFQK